jgi:hypothetical protein
MILTLPAAGQAAGWICRVLKLILRSSDLNLTFYILFIIAEQYLGGKILSRHPAKARRFNRK